MLLTTLKKSGRLNEVLLMSTLSFVCFGLSVFRVLYTKSTLYLFLDWNLFLAFIPWALTTWMVINPRFSERKKYLIMLLAIWLVFFPNAPYIVTDLFHLQHASVMPVWYDTVQIVAFAWTGLLFGFLSLAEVEKVVRHFWGKRFAILVVTGVLFLSGFGIYIGRFLRWNSWDILHHPTDLLSDISVRILHPIQHARTWGVTLFMGTLLNMIYWSLRFFRSSNGQLSHQKNQVFLSKHVKD